VVVTHGSQQALSLLAQVLLDPGAIVIVEDPAYTGALQVFAAAQARIEAVPLDEDGMDVDALAALLDTGIRPVLVHTVPNFHNPGAVTLAQARRKRLAELADRFDFWVVEDDPYGELWFDAPPPAPVAAYSERVIRLSSASKILAPALRTGWLTAPEPVCRAVELVKQGADLCGSALTQQIVARLLADGPWLDAHLDGVRAVYRERAAALVAAVHREFGDRVAVAPVRGGMFCWLEFRDGTDTTDLLTAALAAGVAFVPGAAFAVTDGYRHALRLCFATADGPVLDDAVTRLAGTRLAGAS
jgi:2-aminoadipate transaminase